MVTNDGFYFSIDQWRIRGWYFITIFLDYFSVLLIPGIAANLLVLLRKPFSSQDKRLRRTYIGIGIVSLTFTIISTCLYSELSSEKSVSYWLMISAFAVAAAFSIIIFCFFLLPLLCDKKGGDKQLKQKIFWQYFLYTILMTPALRQQIEVISP